MNHKSTYKIISNLELIVIFFQNEISLIDLKFAMIEIYKDHNYSPDYNLIIDCRKVIFKIDKNEILLFAKFLNINKDNGIIGNRRAAVLTSTPNQVVIAMLIDLVIKFQIKIYVVSTLNAALQKVGLSAVHEDFLI